MYDYCSLTSHESLEIKNVLELMLTQVCEEDLPIAERMTSLLSDTIQSGTSRRLLKQLKTADILMERSTKHKHHFILLDGIKNNEESQKIPYVSVKHD